MEGKVRDRGNCDSARAWMMRLSWKRGEMRATCRGLGRFRGGQAEEIVASQAATGCCWGAMR